MKSTLSKPIKVVLSSKCPACKQMWFYVRHGFFHADPFDIAAEIKRDGCCMGHATMFNLRTEYDEDVIDKNW